MHLASIRRKCRTEGRRVGDVGEISTGDKRASQPRETMDGPACAEQLNGEAPTSLSKEKSRARIGGGVFEFQLAGLVALRLRALRRRLPALGLRFALATNVEGANPFDDLVLHLRWADRAHERALTYFVQLKHKENVAAPVTARDLTGPVSQRNKDFNLRHYYKKFHDAAKRLDATPHKKLSPSQRHLKEWLSKDYRLVLLTTREVYPKAERASSPIDFPFEEALRTGHGEAFSFGEADEDVWHMLGKEQSDSYREFLFRLRVLSAQAQVGALPELLGRALREALGEPLPAAERLLGAYLLALERWWDSDDGACLTHSTLELENVVRDELHAHLQPFEFKERQYAALRERLRGWDASFVVVPGVSDGPRCCALRRVLEELHPGRVLVLTERAIKSYSPAALLALCAALCDELVVGVAAWDQRTRGFASELLLNRACRVRIVSGEWDASVFQLLAAGRGTRCVAWSEQWTLGHLAPHAQRQLLRRRVLFQGARVPLGALAGAWPGLRRGVRGAALEALAAADAPVVVGDPLPPLDALYIPRTLERAAATAPRRPLPRALFLAPSAQVRALVGGGGGGAERLLRGRGDARLLLRGFPEALLRLVRMRPAWEECGDGWIPTRRWRRRSWPEARADAATQWRAWDGVEAPAETAFAARAPPRCLSYEGGRVLVELEAGAGAAGASAHEDLAEVRRWEGVSLLASDPGVGKSTYLTRVAHSLKETRPLHWVLLVRLSHGALMDLLPDDVQVRDVVELLARVAAPGRGRDAARHFLRACLTRGGAGGGASLLLDGVDEVCPSHKQKALRVLELLLRDMRFERLWVAARPVLEEALARTLRRPPLRLRPFSRAQQRRFLLLHWAALADGHGDAGAARRQLLEARVERLLDAVRAATERDGRTLCDVPLYMRMLAEAYRADAASEDVRLSAWSARAGGVTRLGILRKFLEETRKVYWAKSDVPMHKIQNRGWDISSEETFLQHHKACATYLMFSAAALGAAAFRGVEKAVREIVRVLEREKTGIIVKVVDAQPVFNHRMFAEYFAALWFSENYRSLPRSAVELLYKGDLEEVRYFFDALLAEGRALHEAAGAGRLQALLAALRQGGDAAAAQADRGGRTALHHAAIAGHDAAAQALLDRGADVGARDLVLRWTPLRYADELLRLRTGADALAADADAARRPAQPRHLAVIDRLLQAGASARDAPRLFRARDAALPEAVRLDLAALAEALVRRRGPLLMQQLLRRHAYLHDAARHGARRVLARLLRLGFSAADADDAGATPLHLASDAQVCEVLLQHGASALQADKSGATPLHRAAREGRVGACRALVARSPQAADARDARGHTPLRAAALHGRAHACRLLHPLTAEAAGALWAAAACGDAGACEALLRAGADASACDADGDSALHYAARAGHTQVCEALVARGAVPQARGRDGRSALQCAAGAHHQDTYHALLQLQGGAGGDTLARPAQADGDPAHQRRHANTNSLGWVSYLES